jgi:hypothetical protein
MAILAVAAAVAQGVSTIMQGQAAAAQGKAQKKVNEYNAKLAERQGQARLQAAKLESDRLARKGAIVQAANRAIASKSGISISDSVSTVDILADTAYQFHLDRNFLLNQGMQDYISSANQASLLRAEGAYAKAQGKQIQTMSTIAGIGQIGAGLYPYRSSFNLAGDQTAIKNAGGLGTVSNSTQIKNFMEN